MTLAALPLTALDAFSSCPFQGGQRVYRTRAASIFF